MTVWRPARTGRRTSQWSSSPACLAVELGVAQGWDRYIGGHGEMIGIGRFGASATAKVLLEKYGFSVASVVARAKKLLDVARFT
jgi:transketolase